MRNVALPAPTLLGLVCALLAGCRATPEPSVVESPSAAASALAPGAAIPIRIGTGFELESRVLGARRRINVCTPANYAERDEPFPVLYLIDGGVEQDLVPVAGFAALASLSGQYREFIVVGIETLDRRFELTTPSRAPYDLLQIPNNGGADEFRRFIVEEVQPWIEQRYRTTAETAVLGESLAGLFICDTLLRAPESFDHYIAVSPSLWWAERSLAANAAEQLTSPQFPSGRSLYLTVADERDIQRGAELLVHALETSAPAGLTWWYDPLPDEHHHTIYNPATLRALRLIFAPAAE